jgi:flagellin
MTLSINTNVSSLLAQKNLSNNSTKLSSTLQRLATGLKVNGAADSSAGYAIAQIQTATISSLKQGMSNGNDGESMMQVVGGAIQSLTDNLQKLTGLALQSQNGTMSSTQRQNLNSNFSALIAQMENIISTTTYNNNLVLTGEMGSVNIAMGNNNNIAIDMTTNLASSIVSLSDDVLTAGMTASAASAYADLGTTQLATASAGWQTASTTISGISGAAAGAAGGAGSALVITNAAASAVALDLAAAAWFSAAATQYGFNANVASTFASAAAAYVAAAAAQSAFGSTVSTGGVASATTIAAYSTASAANVAAGAAALAAINAAYAQGSSGAVKALNDINADLSTITTLAAQFGAIQANLNAAVANNSEQAIAMESARSTIIDADYGEETANLAKFNVLVQAGASVLQQANSQPQLILKLLG